MSAAAVSQWLAALFPAAPGYVRAEVAERLAGRVLIDAKAQVGQMVEAIARHQFTDYDALRTRHGMTPDEAALCVADEVSALLDDWRGNRSSGSVSPRSRSARHAARPARRR